VSKEQLPKNFFEFDSFLRLITYYLPLLMNADLHQYYSEIKTELHNILDYWMEHTPDMESGGFYGTIDACNIAVPMAPKGIVLNSRILWTFSAAYNRLKNPDQLAIAQRAYRYITEHFIDPTYGGVYWSVNYAGEKLNDRKQVYGLAFTVYGLSEYYKATGAAEALHHAVALFTCVEQYSFDNRYAGYGEAYSRNWQSLQDMRLSDKDDNAPKTMNTHLHLVEAYANLYAVWPDPILKTQIENLLQVFNDHIIDSSGNLGLFFDEQWHPRSSVISYGHNIEAAWLLQQAAEHTGNNLWIDKMRKLALSTALTVIDAIDTDGGLWYEYDPRKQQLTREKHWWPQAEAMIGFMNAYEITNDNIWLERSFTCWDFVKRYIKDAANGEWFWGIDAGHTIMPNQDKAGFWKCPYHNARACMELERRLGKMIAER